MQYNGEHFMYFILLVKVPVGSWHSESGHRGWGVESFVEVESFSNIYCIVIKMYQSKKWQSKSIDISNLLGFYGGFV